MSLFRVAVAVTPVFPLFSIYLVPVHRGRGVLCGREEVVVHHLVHAFGYRDLGFNCGEISLFKWPGVLGAPLPSCLSGLAVCPITVAYNQSKFYRSRVYCHAHDAQWKFD